MLADLISPSSGDPPILLWWPSETLAPGLELLQIDRDDRLLALVYKEPTEPARVGRVQFPLLTKALGGCWYMTKSSTRGHQRWSGSWPSLIVTDRDGLSCLGRTSSYLSITCQRLPGPWPLIYWGPTEAARLLALILARACSCRSARPAESDRFPCTCNTG
jgi:hypothetical protein